MRYPANTVAAVKARTRNKRGAATPAATRTVANAVMSWAGGINPTNTTVATVAADT